MSSRLTSSATSTHTSRGATLAQMLDGDRSKQVDLVLSDEQKAQVRVALARRNGQAAALGNLHRLQCLRFAFYLGPDYYVNFIVTAITMFIVLSNMAIAWYDVTAGEYWFAWGMVSLFLFASVAVMCTDPGVYPRLKPGEEDPLGQDTSFVLCRVCGMRRPPRTSHCYVCNVCVCEHDHHCGILGGCVGVRNLRWFTLYLVSCSSATFIGVYWQLRFLYRALTRSDRRPSGTSSMATSMGSATRTTAFTLPAPPLPYCKGDDCDPGFRYVTATIFMLVDCTVGLLVGSMGLMYMWFVVSSITRRIWQRRHSPWYQFNFVPAEVWRNVRHALFPPGSMLMERVDSSDEGATVSLL